MMSMAATVILPQVCPPVEVPRIQLNRWVKPHPTKTVNSPLNNPARAAAVGLGVVLTSAQRARSMRDRVAPAASPVAVRARCAKRVDAALTAENVVLVLLFDRDRFGRRGCCCRDWRFWDWRFWDWRCSSPEVKPRPSVTRGF